MNKLIVFLLAAVLAGVCYLVWRDHAREQQRAQQVADSLAENETQTASKPPASRLDPRQFAPLRDRPSASPSPTQAARPFPPHVASTESGAPPIDPASATGGSLAGTSSRPRTQFGGAAGGGALVGSVNGRVLLRGTPPPEKVITLDPACGGLHPAPMMTRHYVLGQDSGLANVFVYVKGGVTPMDRQQAAIPVLDNINCAFEPYVLGVRVGQPFSIRNSDPLLHNAHGMPKNSREFNLGLPVKGMSVQRMFDKPEVLVRIKCDVHPWMFAYIGVVDHPWFAVTDSNGQFALPEGLAPGRYTLAAVHVKAGELTQEISVSGSAVEPVQFTFDVPENLAQAQP